MHIKRLLIIIPLLVVTLAWVGLVSSARATSTTVVINELQTGTPQSASQEFVELYNTGSTHVDLSGWHIDYKSATGQSWTKRASLSGTLLPGAYFVAAPAAYLSTANATWSSSLSADAGNVRLVDSTGNEVDVLGYGDAANAAEDQSALAPAAGQSLERMRDANGAVTDTDHNASDFVLQNTPTPGAASAGNQATPATAATETDSTTPVDPALVTATPIASAASYQGLVITELFIDPASPLTDTKDEFIELLNTTSTPINLAGLSLQTGSNFHDHYALPSQVVAPGQYWTAYASQSKLGLTNSGGAARLVDGAAQTIDQTANYTQALTGQSWSLVNGMWQWTSSVTPNAANVLVVPAATATGKSASTGAVSRSSASKTSAAKAASAAKAKVAKAATAAKTAAVSAVDASTSGTGRFLLIGLAGLTIAYGIYEYRQRLYNYYRLARSHLRLRS